MSSGHCRQSILGTPSGAVAAAGTAPATIAATAPMVTAAVIGLMEIPSVVGISTRTLIGVGGTHALGYKFIIL
ncbi:hypothetical protein Acsp05_27110 [Actinokineospora sp. NBRC 105648]|nr:hypothetical protein Acsp05_27110 [Actinokineospora sp. NBRC 105648]